MNPAAISDWRLTLNEGRAVVFLDNEKGAKNPDGEAKAFADGLIKHMVGMAAKKSSFSFEFDGIKFRAQLLSDENYKLRRIEKVIRSTDELGLHPIILEELLKRQHEQGGLTLIAGPAGSGKTTTGVSITKARLEKYGGYCLAIEDPKEFDFEGFHGDNGGFVDQIEADSPEDYRNRVMEAMRCFPAKTPGILYLGEIRDHVTATESVRASLSGFQGVSTVHAYDLISAIQRMLAYMGGEDSPGVRSLLADALNLIVFQRFDIDGNLTAEWLTDSDKVKGAIKNGKLDSLKDDIFQNNQRIRKRGSNG